MTDDQIAEFMGWSKRAGYPPLLMAQCRKLVQAAQEEERRKIERERDHDQAPA